MGAANQKSVAAVTAKMIKEFGGKIILSVQNEKIGEKVKKLFPDDPIYFCDVADENDIKNFGLKLKKDNHLSIDGLLHSLAFANFIPGRAYYEVPYHDFLEAAKISCLSLGSVCHSIKDLFQQEASVVTVSISSTKATSYGLLGPIKAMLDSTIPYLAKSFSNFSKVRFNSVAAGPLKTSASAGIPGFLENYIYSEKLMLRGFGLKTEEVANTILFLLSSRSGGINGTSIVVDGGMGGNYFDDAIVKCVVNNLPESEKE